MNSQVCTLTETPTQFCTHCTEQLYIQTIPPHIATRALLGWNAGANSKLAKRYSGNVVGTWTARLNTASVVVGIAADPRGNVNDVESILYGIVTFTQFGATFAQPIIAGVLVGVPFHMSGDTAMKVVRSSGVTQFFINDMSTPVLTAPSTYDGAALLASVLYATGDIIK